MSRAWKVALIGLAALTMLGMLTAGAGYAYLQYRSNRNLTLARAALENQQWGAAKRYFAWYLTRHREDTDALRQYIAACSRITENRRQQLNDIGRALLQIATEHPDTPQYRTEALQFLYEHRLYGSLKYYATLFLRDYPGDALFEYYKAVATEKRDAPQEAIDAYSMLVDAGSDRPDVYGSLAILSHQQGFSEQARGVLEKARGKFGDDARVRLQWARFYLSTREYDKAAAEAEAAVAGLPDSAEAFLVAGQIAFAAKQYDVAAGYLEKAAQLNPKDPESYLHLASAYELRGELDRAIVLCQGIDRFVRLDNAELLFALAELLIEAKRFEEAHDVIEEYREAYPEHDAAFIYFEGRELLANGAAKEAAEKFGSAVKRQPDFVRAQYYQALAYLKDNAMDLAKSTLEAYLRTRPDDEQAQSAWSHYFGRPRTAETALEAADGLLARPEPDPAALVVAARDLMRLQPVDSSGDSDLVARLLNRAIERDPQYLDAHLTLADYWLRRRDFKEASAALSRAESTGVDKAQLLIPQAAIALAEGNVAAAQERYASASAAPGFRRQDAVRWAELFTDHGHLDLGLKLLADAAAADETARNEIAMDEIALCLRAGDAARAAAAVAEFESRGVQDRQLIRRLDEQKLEVARVLLEQDEPDYSQVEQLLAGASRSMPDDAKVKILNARIRMAGPAPDLDQAETVGKLIVQKEPDNVEALLLLYDVAVKKGQQGAAAGFAQRAAAVAPQDRRVQLAVADSLRQSGRFAVARRWVQNALAAKPNDARALLLLFEINGQSGELDQARAVLQKLQGIYGADSKERQRLLGLLAFYEGGFAAAETAFRKQLEAHPDDVSALDNLVAVLLRQDKTKDAEVVLKQYADQNNASVDAWCRLGQFYLTQDDSASVAAASSAFTRAIYLYPDYGPALRGMMDVQIRMKNYGGALSLCNRYLLIQPDDAEVLWRRAELLLMESRSQDTALASIERAIALVERPQYFLCRGLIYLNMGRFKEALADLQRVADAQAVRSARLDAGLALAYAETNELELARQFITSASEKPEDGVADAFLERARKRVEELGK